MCHITDNITYKTGQSQQRIDNGKYVGQTQSGMTYGSMGTDSSPAHHSGQPLCCISGDISLWPMFPLDSSLQSATSSLQSHPLTGAESVCVKSLSVDNGETDCTARDTQLPWQAIGNYHRPEVTVNLL